MQCWSLRKSLPFCSRQTQWENPGKLVCSHCWVFTECFYEGPLGAITQIINKNAKLPDIALIETTGCIRSKRWIWRRLLNWSSRSLLWFWGTAYMHNPCLSEDPSKKKEENLQFSPVSWRGEPNLTRPTVWASCVQAITQSFQTSILICSKQISIWLECVKI